jgi:hypothetical protein
MYLNEAALMSAMGTGSDLIRLNVRFGSKADMCSALACVRFGPKADTLSSPSWSLFLAGSQSKGLADFIHRSDLAGRWDPDALGKWLHPHRGTGRKLPRR